MADKLIKVMGGPDGPGSFIGLMVKDGKISHVTNMWDWNANGGDAAAQVMTGKQLGTVIQSYRLTPTGDIPAGYLPADVAGRWTGESTAAPNTPGGDDSTPGGAGSNELTPENEAAFARLASYLDARGLGSLFKLTADGKPGGWLWDRLLEGVDTADELQIAIEDTTAFKNRYGVITELRERAVAGENVDVPTVDEVLEYESQAAMVMRRAGLPSFMYDSYTKVHDLLRNNLSIPELAGRIEVTWNTVTNTNPAVRAEFEEMFGIQGDAALAAFIMDPERSEAELERMARTALTSGNAQQYGLDLTRARAEQLVGMPFTDAGIAERFQNVALMSGVFNENFSERNDLTAEGEGLDMEVFGSASARRLIEQRIARRTAIDRASFGGASTTSEGIGGLGSARDS